MAGPRKACPVVLRRAANGRLEVLAFRHPLAGCQLVKGDIEAGETAEQAAERELEEESGVAGRAIAYLGSVPMIDLQQEWHVVMCRTEPLADTLADTWTHHTRDGGGLDFAFFWHALDQAADQTWHPIFRHALAFIASRVDALP